MTKTRATTVFERARATVIVGMLVLGCAKSGGTSGETHFVCAATPDCAVHGSGLTCVQGLCSRGDGSETPTNGASTSSEAGGPPAQGALTLNIRPTSGKTCQHTSGQLSVPFAQNAGVYGELLGCDLSQNCKPNEYVVVDREPGTNLACSVAPMGDTFAVAITLNIEGVPSMQFQANGAVSPTGGTLAINETNSVAMGGGRDEACAVTIIPNRGVVGLGKIWAQFTCTEFRDPNDLSDTGCTVEGAFLFENCDG